MQRVRHPKPSNLFATHQFVARRLLMAYPSFRVIDRASPPASPSVVARILTIQNTSVTRGTLLKASVLRRPFCNVATLHLRYLVGQNRTLGKIRKECGTKNLQICLPLA